MPETAVMQQEEGQAFWMYRGHAQHVQTAMVPITPEQIREGWHEIRRQEELQRSLLDLEERRRQDQQAQKKQHASADQAATDQHASPTGKKNTSSRPSTGATPKRKEQAPTSNKAKQSTSSISSVSVPPKPPASEATSPASLSPIVPESTTPPAPDPEDDEPDRL